MRHRRRNGFESFEPAYRAHVGEVYAFFAYSVGESAAEDLTATAFERALRAWKRYDPDKASERTWLLAIARNLQIDHYRSAARRVTDSTDERPQLLDGLVDDGEGVARALAADGLRELLEPLSERDRAVVALRFAADLKTGEIAEVMNLSVANVQQILSRSLRRLRESLDQVSGSAAPGAAPHGRGR